MSNQPLEKVNSIKKQIEELRARKNRIEGEQNLLLKEKDKIQEDMKVLGFETSAQVSQALTETNKSIDELIVKLEKLLSDVKEFDLAKEDKKLVTSQPQPASKPKPQSSVIDDL